MNILRHALLTVNGQTGLPAGNDAFDAAQYSRFKYGSLIAAKQFGVALADGFVKQVLHANPQLLQAGWLLSSSAYKNIPTAAHAATQFFAERLGTLGYAAPTAARLMRQRIFEGEYEKLRYGARRVVLKNSGITLQANNPAGRTLVVVDDIRVTGAHESCILNLAKDSGLAAVCFVYIVNVDAHKLDPTLEHRLNSAAIDTLPKLRELVQTEAVAINARLCKRLLLWQTPQELFRFAQTLPPAFVGKVAQAVQLEGYHAHDRLRPAAEALQAAAQLVHQTSLA